MEQMCSSHLNHIRHFNNPAVAVIIYLLAGGKFDFPVSNCINSVILSNTDACSRKKLGASLTDYNISRNGKLAIMKLDAKAF